VLAGLAASGGSENLFQVSSSFWQFLVSLAWRRHCSLCLCLHMDSHMGLSAVSLGVFSLVSLVSNLPLNLDHSTLG
jgi:hypothetical protein